ncbi:MAG TPA: chemotaxis protein CheW [Candidatus Sulfotelmatobacter sp.]|nr:chemotaxis protein CheW [Candidatus Sulfotelmatobacter sp.]
MDEIVKDFLIESGENLDRLDQELVQLEGDPSSKELLSSIFRTIHTIKGTCSFLGFVKLEKLSHAGEDLLARLRDGELALTAEITSGLLAMVDAIRLMLAAIKDTEQDSNQDYAPLIARLATLQNPTPAANKTITDAPVSDSARAPRISADAENEKSDPDSSPMPAPVLDEDLADPSKLGGLLLQRGLVTREDLAQALHQQEMGRKRLGDILIAQGAAHPEDVLEAQRALEARNPEAAVETIRVGVNLLDRLMNLVGELVLARNHLLQIRKRVQNPDFLPISQHINLITTELQGEVMKTRMQPISNLWNKFPRTVRDLARNCGKDIRLEMEGQDTELDRTIVENMKDPMTHLVRNAIDHGIEPAEERKQAGKESAGLLKLRAFHQGGHVNIEVIDDGAGLNRKRICEKAIERRLITFQQAEQMADADIFNLIFLPGFSTAQTVTNVSGRGVGMDVVKTQVEKIGGTVDLQSIEGRGTTIKIKIPLTLAIIPALLVKSGGERFAIPQVSLLEVVRLENRLGIERVHNAPVYRLRGRLLPLLDLSSELGLAPTRVFPSSDSASNLVVVQAHGCAFGILVDEILDSEEIVVKPLGPHLKRIVAYSGATIFGDGRVALILDIVGLAQNAGIVSQYGSESPPAETHQTQANSNEHPESLLIVECDGRGRIAIPLSLVTRLEELPASSIESAGPLEVTQYHGEVLPLMRLSQVLYPANRQPENPARDRILPVVVCSESGRSVGLIVDRIVDIVEHPQGLETPGQRPGVLGSSIIESRITELIDIPFLMRQGIYAAGNARAARGGV